MPNKKIKIFASLLIAGQLLILPLAAFAQAVPTCDPGNGDSCAGGYIAGIAANAAAEGGLKGEYGTYKATCVVPLETFEQSNKVAQLGFSGLAMIGGNSVLLAQFQAQIEAYNLFLGCAKIHQATLTGLPAGNTFLSNVKQSMLNEIDAAIHAYTSKLADSQARFNNAKQGFWKTLVFNILIKTSKTVADSLVKKLVSTYKINNIKQYVDSVATLMYDNQFLRDNFHDAQGQLMARAILENPILRYKIQPGIFLAADTALGFNPKELNTNDPDFYAKMAQVGSSVANPYYQNSVYVGGVDQARANSLAYAQGQIQQSNGYKAPVSCSGSLSQQQAIDAQNTSAQARLADRKALVDNLQQAKTLGQPVSDSDIQRANADYEAAKNAYNNLPFTVYRYGISECWFGELSDRRHCCNKNL